MGSMARGEMCPYSDIEFAFIIEEKTERTLIYFRILAQLVELKMINLGETKFPIFGEWQDSPTPGGFSMDSGGNTPLGKPGFYELIDTPEGLAQFQCEHWMDADIIVTNALSSVCHVAGNRKLMNKYYQAKESQLNITDGVFSFTGIAFREKLSLQLLRGNLVEFKPDLSKQKQETNAFGIKKELYRPFQSILGSLAIFYGIEAESSFAIIDLLLKKGIISSQGEKNLKKALQQVLALRFEAHAFYQKEEEFLLQIEEGKIQDPHFLYLDEKRLSMLHEIYKVLIPFHRCGEGFLYGNKVEAFKNKIFYDDDPAIQGEELEEAFEYIKAQEAFQHAVSLDPNDIDAQLQLGGIEREMGKIKDALPRHLKALEVAKKKYGPDHYDVAKSLNNIGVVFSRLGNYQMALENYQEALKIWLKIMNEDDIDLATCYSNIGVIYDYLGNFEKALEYSQKALAIRLKTLGKRHYHVAISYNSISVIFCHIGRYKEALPYAHKGLKIRQQALKEHDPSLAESYFSLANIYNKLLNYEQALEYSQKSLNILIHVFDPNHPHVTIIYNLIGVLHYDLGKYEIAMKYYRHALKIKLKIHGENHSQIAMSYNYIGLTYYKLEDHQQALEYYLKALKIWLQNESTTNVAVSYNNLGKAYCSLGNYQKSLESHQQALELYLQGLSSNHPNVCLSYNNIGEAYQSSGDYKNALEYHQKALQMRLQILGEEHPDTARSYNNMGLAYDKLGKYEIAFELHQKAVTSFLSAKYLHPDALKILQNFILVAQKLYPTQHQSLVEVHQLCIQRLGAKQELTQKLLELIK